MLAAAHELEEAKSCDCHKMKTQTLWRGQILLLQALLPRCNVAVMVQLQPQMFLGKSEEHIEAQVGSAYEIIQRDLPISYVDAMIQVFAPIPIFCRKRRLYTGFCYSITLTSRSSGRLVYRGYCKG